MGEFLIIVAVVIAVCVYAFLNEVYDDMHMHKRDAKNDYDTFINVCKDNKEVLNWTLTLNDRFEKFMESNEYKGVKPYESFNLKLPITFFNVRTYIVADKHKKLKFVVNTSNPSEDYLKYCVGYKDGLDEFINKCKKAALDDELERKRMSKIQKL